MTNPPFELTTELMASVARLTGKRRRAAMEYIAQKEWERCAEDVFYWFDSSRHFKSAAHPQGTPYVYTQERHPMFECVACGAAGGMFPTNRQKIHLKFAHELEYTRHSDVQKMFRELPGKREFKLLEYMPPIIETWLENPIVLIEKSRDMMATWLTVTLYTWDAMFHRDRQICFQSETATKTTELIERVNFIYKSQPKFLRDLHKGQFNSGTSRAGYMRWPSMGSEIIGLAQGADQIRQYHPSAVFVDECAFHVDAADLFMAVKPSIQNGGKYTAVSSANPGFFMMACGDRLDE